MGGLQRPGGTGSTRARRNARLIEQNEQELRRNARKAEIQVAGKALKRAPVLPKTGNLFPKQCEKEFREPAFFFDALRKCRMRSPRGRRHADNPRDILGSRTPPSLLCAAVQQGTDCESAAYIEKAAALGASELMRAHREEIRKRLSEELSKAKAELFNLRFASATGQLEDHGRLKAVRRDIARIYTIVRERELGIRTAPSTEESK